MSLLGMHETCEGLEHILPVTEILHILALSWSTFLLTVSLDIILIISVFANCVLDVTLFQLRQRQHSLSHFVILFLTDEEIKESYWINIST